MRCYRFNGKRSKDILRKYRESSRKGSYQIYTCKSKMLKSGFFENQTWGALHKCWKGYIIALNRFEVEEMRKYATRIQHLQHELGLEISQFPWLGTFEFGVPEDNPEYLDDENWEEVDRIVDNQLEEFRRMKEEDRSEPSF
jgi:hypothetical protein